ncbi:CIA30-domain-containing protein [Cucurbitaria berberidis CBS 394.84]|uniref:CIA30-domain-containing protein n=1 Tax=Cucurbitaria berberidis CBS 394.84 TaxID=1168544 RepID=A0A9P4G8T6_9PLEO|nr:CIA30-domain-containing protein [Cucurbitaria berberidis CBS 394.84]KAF1840834.1 CIA30-domain-containing protein [Cucurbitaria berberidis CBS 394.84]
MGNKKELELFGGSKGWKAEDWTASDDRVRGGSSQSYLDTSGSSAHFHGTLDIKTLGGAGFASQRTTGDDRSWDLSDYAGIHLRVDEYDGKKYTLTLKDEILPLNPENGREQSTISYEYDFSSSSAEGLYVPWHALKATYRGKEKKDAKPLNTKSVKRFSIMMRSFFGEQEGDFSLEIKSIKAISQSTDPEKGVVGEKGDLNEPGKPWNWKESNLVGLALILSSTWAICFGFCWWKGYDTSFMRFGRWWRMARS